jgi:hypothetical protein
MKGECSPTKESSLPSSHFNVSLASSSLFLFFFNDFFFFNPFFLNDSCSLDFNRDRVVLLVVIGMTGTCDGEFGDNVVVIEGD